MEIIERIAERYDVHEMPLGKVYRWSPEQVLLRCSKCGKTMTYKKAEITEFEGFRCECGNDNTARVREELVLRLLDEEYEAHHHPWRYWHSEESEGIPA
ncbi:MAG: hypothetical protein JOZ19_11030 [Rubrobacter sp.]|nr:hypothetical protein [Rubrobacter sp.]